MPTYIYETIPQNADQKPERFEVRQSMYDAPLKQHPQTGQPIQRVIAGGIGIISHAAQAPRQEGCCGGVGGPGCHCECGN